MFDDIETAGKAIGDRLAFNDDFKRSDITDFAVAARDIVMGKRRIDPELLTNAKQLLPQIQLQIDGEARFPAGVRIGTFVHSPICVILASANGEPCPVPTNAVDILAWLRRKTGWDIGVDALTERAIGIRLPSAARELAELHVQDPVSFYLQMSFEFGHPGLDATVAYPICPRLHGERHWTFHAKRRLVDVMKQLAEWCRAIAIADYLFQREAAHHLALRDYVDSRVTLHKASPHIRSIVESIPLPVPMLKAILDNGKPFAVQNMMAEFERVVMPSVHHGNGTKRPLYHFYGLGAVDVLMVAFLDILCVSRGISAPSSALSGPHVRHPHFEHFGQDRLIEIVEATINKRWPNYDATIKQDAALRAKILRRRYARASVVSGSAYRFDPEFWSRPERDARLFQRLATMTCAGCWTLRTRFPSIRRANGSPLKRARKRRERVRVGLMSGANPASRGSICVSLTPRSSIDDNSFGGTLGGYVWPKAAKRACRPSSARSN